MALDSQTKENMYATINTAYRHSIIDSSLKSELERVINIGELSTLTSPIRIFIWKTHDSETLLYTRPADAWKGDIIPEIKLPYFEILKKLRVIVNHITLTENPETLETRVTSYKQPIALGSNSRSEK